MPEPTNGMAYPLCKRGHERSPENVTAKRECRQCKRLIDAAWFRRKYAANADFRAYHNAKSAERYYSTEPRVHFLILQARVRADLKARQRKIDARKAQRPEHS